MPAHLDKVLAHAGRQLPATDGLRPSEQLPVYRRFLKIEEHRLRLRHRAGGGGLEICRARVELLDVLLRHLFTNAWQAAACTDREKTPEPPVTLLAIGGYGRGELNPGSDVDILFLHDLPEREAGAKARAEVDDLIQQVLYLLWDVGFKVGHATRSIEECILHANRDDISKTALLEARRLAGSGALFEEFQTRFQLRCVRGKERAYLRWRVEDQETRHAKFGPSVFVQEPHLKNGSGGLRDFHNLIWSAYFLHGAANSADLVRHRLLTEGERRDLHRARDFILRVRTELHYLNERATDTLTLYFQGQIANRFAYPQRNVIKRSEAFMKDYYRHARALYLITNNAFERLCREAGVLDASGPPHLLDVLRRVRPTAAERFDGFYSREGYLFAERKEVFNEDPVRLLRVFAHAQERDLELEPALAGLVRRRVRLVDRTFMYSRAAREVFSTLLSRPGKVARVLRQMHETNLLGRFLPEFGGLTCLVQHEFNHRYTADEHTLVCLEKLDALLTDPAAAERFADYRRLLEETEDPFILYLAILLHDTGKATGARAHAEASAFFAQKVAARLQLSPERRRTLIFLVDHHLTLSSTAQTRNLDDPDTIAEFAGIVQTRARLDALMLLTLADGQGTSDEGWSDWKEMLVWQLHRATVRWLAGGERDYRQSLHQREALQARLTEKLDAGWQEEIDAHFHLMPERYFETFDAESIAAHLLLLRGFFHRQLEAPAAREALAPVTRWTAHPGRGHSEVTFANWQRPGGLARIAGSFAAAGLNILSADRFPRDDQISINVFRVCDARHRAVDDPRDIAAVESVLRQAFADPEFALRPLLLKARQRQKGPLVAIPAGRPRVPEIVFPTRIVTRDAPAGRYTLLEVQTADRLGLLYDLLEAINGQDVRVVLSRIATEKGGAVDSFYLTDHDGARITDEATLARVRDAVRKAIEG